jgi:UDPglucose 6-dehydrogenase
MVGTGYVGLVSGACFADFGHQVDCVDIDGERIATLERGEIPFYEPGLATLVEKNRKTGRLNFGTDLGQAVEPAEVVMIAVQTPPRETGEADLQYVMRVGEDVAKLLRPGQYKVICTKSTVPVGTARELERTVRQNAVSGVDFDVASNPEFLREGSSIEDFMRPDRVVIGTSSERAEQIMRDLYRPLYLSDTPVVSTTLETSELIKYAANAFLAVKISYVNEVSNLCEELGADVKVVARAMGLDRRIGPKFLHAGLGFGGSCLPKDTRAIVHMGDGAGQHLQLVEAAIEVNRQRVDRAIEKLESLLGALDGRTVALLGLAFKPNTDDIREAPSLRIAERLHALGARVRGCDPEAGQRFLAQWPTLELSPDPYLCVEGADACLLVTEWNPYRELDLSRLRATMKGDVFLDCRNVYDRERVEQAGFRYGCFGR